MAKVLTVGSAMVDVIVIIADGDVERMTMHNATSSFLMLEQGRKTEALAITDHTGGGAINAAVSMARQGHDVATLIKIGHDRDGERIIARLEHEGINPDCIVRTDELQTGTAVMISSHDRNAAIFTQRGANTLLREEDIKSDLFEDRDMIYVTNLSNQSADRFPEIVRLGRKSGAFVAVNPGIRQLTSRTNAFLDSLPDIDLLALNAHEAASLVPTISAKCVDYNKDETPNSESPRLKRVGLECSGFKLGLSIFMEEIRKLGVSMIVVTDGKDGAYLGNGEGVFYCPTKSVEVKGTAGAGDAFISTVSASLIEGRKVENALQRATLNAAAVVSEIDAQSGLLTGDCIDQMLKEARNEIMTIKLV